jgi:hypothetical protein
MAMQVSGLLTCNRLPGQYVVTSWVDFATMLLCMGMWSGRVGTDTTS